MKGILVALVAVLGLTLAACGSDSPIAAITKSTPRDIPEITSDVDRDNEEWDDVFQDSKSAQQLYVDIIQSLKNGEGVLYLDGAVMDYRTDKTLVRPFLIREDGSYDCKPSGMGGHMPWEDGYHMVFGQRLYGHDTPYFGIYTLNKEDIAYDIQESPRPPVQFLTLSSGDGMPIDNEPNPLDVNCYVVPVESRDKITQLESKSGNQVLKLSYMPYLPFDYCGMSFAHFVSIRDIAIDSFESRVHQNEDAWEALNRQCPW